MLRFLFLQGSVAKGFRCCLVCVSIYGLILWWYAYTVYTVSTKSAS